MTNSIDENIRIFDECSGYGYSFDVKKALLNIGTVKAVLYYMDGFVKKDELIKIHESCLKAKDEDIQLQTESDCFSKLAERIIPYADIKTYNECKAAADALHAGMAVLFADGYSECAALDIRDYPKRSISEPSKSKTLRGPHEGFTESLITNSVLIRRRVKTSSLRFELFNIGSISETDVSLCYIESMCDKKLLETLRRKLSSVKTESLTMAQESLAELIFPKKGLASLNPLPTVRYVERPDTAAAMLCEGRILIMCDTSPSVLCIPAGLFSFLEEADDYYFPPVTGSYLRLVRLFIIIASVILVPLWLYFAENPHVIPGALSFIGDLGEFSVPIFAQILIIELAIDGLKLASLNTPDTLSNSLSVVGGLLLGDFAVKSGWFVPQTILYCSFTAIANFIPTNYELGYSIKFSRILILILTHSFGLYGFAAGVFIVLVTLLLTKTPDGKSYLYPVVPFNSREAKRILFRPPLK
ncbi:MAG: spore germination protein [Ruminococcaceae bacterium]|nr:spore germination protein [Oscillospiraceae bacterium]